MTRKGRQYSSRTIADAILAVFLSLPVTRKAEAAAKPSIQSMIPVAHSHRNVRRAQGPGVDEASVKRWAELFANILGEFSADDRDPTGRVQGDYSTRTVRVIGAADDRDVGVTRTLTKRELATADLKALARRLYTDARKAAEQR